MKTFLAIAVGISVASSAFSVTPEQVGLYAGKLTTTGADFNIKKSLKESGSVLMQIYPDGSVDFVSETAGGFSGNISLGTYRGAIDTGVIVIPVELKGTKLTGSVSLANISGADTGAVVKIEFKMKRTDGVLY